MVDAIAATGVGRDVAGGAGAPVVPAALRSDPVAAASAAGLASKLGPAKLARSTGQVPRADAPLARLAALVAHDARLSSQTAAVLGATELLTYRLTGRL